MTTLQDCRALDAQDPLRSLRAHFTLPGGVIYLDGNSLGVAPKAAAARVAEVVEQEWAQGLIRSWNDAGWVDLPQRLGDQLAPLIGAGPGEVVCTDTTSINLYKVLSAALNIVRADAPARSKLLSERSNFPTDPRKNIICSSMAHPPPLQLRLWHWGGYYIFRYPAGKIPARAIGKVCGSVNMVTRGWTSTTGCARAAATGSRGWRRCCWRRPGPPCWWPTAWAVCW